MNIEQSIEATRKGFESSFAEGSLYDRQTQDETHLKQIIEALPIQSGMRILDLGTGTGYLAMQIAKEKKDVSVVGLDIVAETLERNKLQAKEKQIGNIEFVAYNGIDFPFDEQSFDMVITRYALHHFPKIEHTFSEIARILKTDGVLFIADPTPNDDDVDRFVDAYMQMKPDGHIRYYTKDEWKQLGEEAGLSLTDAFETKITFPRLRETAYGFDKIKATYKKEVLDSYDVQETSDGTYIFITQRVWNLMFSKQ